MRLWTMLALSLLAAACASGGDEGEFITDFNADIRSQPGHAVHGTARAVASVGRTVITVNMEDGEPGAVHPWHVHEGDCGSGGAVVGGANSYPPLALDGNGSDREVATLSLQLSDDADYHVNVHLSAEAMGTIVACGALVD